LNNPLPVILLIHSLHFQHIDMSFIAELLAKACPLAHLTCLYLRAKNLKMLLKVFTCVLLSSMSALLLRTDAATGRPNPYMFLAYVLFNVVYSPLADWFSNTWYSEASANVVKQFNQDMFAKYDRADYMSRKKTSPRAFQQRMSPVASALNMIITWGFANFVKILENIVACVFISWDEPWIVPAIIAFGISVVTSTDYLQKGLLKEDATKKTAIEGNRNYFNLLLGQLQDRFVAPTAVSNLENEVLEIRKSRVNDWNRFDCIRSTLGRAPLLILLFVNNPLAMLAILTQLVDSVTNMTRFISTYRKMDMDYTRMQEMWSKMTFTEDATQVDRTVVAEHGITVTEALVIGENDKVLLKITKPITFTAGGRYLLHGASGCGKSTFVNALVGNIKGMQFTLQQPENYRSHFSVLSQTMKESLCLDKVTMRQVFDNAPCEHELTIRKLFTRAGLGARFAEWGFDTLLDESMISGGEKTRLTNILSIYRAGDIPVYVWDEPDQGVDHKTSTSMINDLLEMMPEKTIIMVLHSPELISRIAWTGKIEIESPLGA
jgi:ABC-type multidrug transport system fused ATPase/permease subunit